MSIYESADALNLILDNVRSQTIAFVKSEVEISVRDDHEFMPGVEWFSEGMRILILTGLNLKAGATDSEISDALWSEANRMVRREYATLCAGNPPAVRLFGRLFSSSSDESAAECAERELTDLGYEI